MDRSDLRVRPSRYRIIRAHACTRYADCYKHLHIVTVNPRLQNKIIARLVALLRPAENVVALTRDARISSRFVLSEDLCRIGNSARECVRFHGCILCFFYSRARLVMTREKHESN